MKKISVIILSNFIVIFLLLELALHIISNIDENDNTYIFQRKLKPYSLPISSTEKKISKYLDSDSSLLLYDKNIGWSYRPLSKSNKYIINKQGIRVEEQNKIYPVYNDNDIIRIALIGDSFTAGDEITFNETWGYMLENHLNSISNNKKNKFEVINFGSGGYGLDQILIKFKRDVVTFNPDIIILGFQVGNIDRSLNIFRSIKQSGSGIPFTKPRYIIDKDHLVLINSPTIEPSKIVSVLKDFSSSNLMEHEYYYNEDDYSQIFSRKSKLISFIQSLVTINRFNSFKVRNEFYNINSEGSILALKIIKELSDEVAKINGDLIIVHIPTKTDISDLYNHNSTSYTELLDIIKNKYDVIDPNIKLMNYMIENNIDDLFENVHYSYKSNEIISLIISDKLLGEN